MTDSSRRIVLGALSAGFVVMFALSVAWRMGDHPLIRQRPEAARTAAARRVESVEAVLVVYRPLLFVRQDRIRLVDFLKLLLGFLITRIHIGVIFFCH